MKLNPSIAGSRSFFIWLSVAMLPPQASAQSPVYHHSFTDDVWSPAGGGAFRAPVSSEIYSNEIWERSVEDGKWVESGGYRTTTGKYYAYGDLSSAALGYDEHYLYLYDHPVHDHLLNQQKSNLSVFCSNQKNG